MKLGNIFKYLFALFAIGIIVFAGYTIYDNNKKKEEESKQVAEEKAKEDITNKVTDIRIGITNYDNINPIITNNKDILNLDFLIFEPLFNISSDYKLEACLATSSSNIGNNTYVITTNAATTFSDGTIFTSNDVEFTINKIKESNSIYKANVEHIVSTEIIDATTIKINLDTEIPFFEYLLTFPILSSNYYVEDDFFTTEKAPIGTGMYMISDFSGGSITLSKNPKYRSLEELKPFIETIKINLYSSKGEEFNSFKISNIDMLSTTNLDYTNYVGTLGFIEHAYPGRNFDFLAFNCKDNILSKREVRQAIAMCINKDNIISSVFNNKVLKANYPLDYGNYLYNSNSNKVDHNVEQARKILEEAGWENISGRWSKKEDGRTIKLEIKISVRSEDIDRMAVCNLIKQQLESMGIIVNIEEISNEKYLDYIENKDYQVLFTGIVNSFSPDLTYFFGDGNVLNYNNQEMKSLLNTAQTATSISDLKDKYQRIYNIYSQDIPFVGLYRNKNIMLTSQNLVGTFTPNNYKLYYGVNTWYRK